MLRPGSDHICGVYKRILLALALVTQQAQAASPAGAPVGGPVGAPAVTAGQASLAGLSDPKNLSEAAQVVHEAEARPVSAYLGDLNAAVTPDQLNRFEADLDKVVRANVLIGFADNGVGFRAWWPTKRTQILLSRGLMGTQVSLQLFFVQVYMNYKVDAATAANDPTIVTGWMQRVITNPVVKWVASSTYTFTTGAFVMITGIIWGAMTANPIGGVVGAFVEPIFRPLREKISVFGFGLLGKLGVKTNAYLFTKGKASEARKSLTDAREVVHDMQTLANGMGYDMTAAQYENNMAKLQNAWNQTNQIWLSTQPSSFQTGRSVLTDAYFFRAQHFSTTVFQGIQLAETYRQAIENTVDRIKKTAPANADVDGAVNRLTKAMSEHFLVDKKDPAKAAGFATEIEAAKSQVLASGASAQQLERIVKAQEVLMVAARHSATTMASHLFHEAQFAEFNRRLPPEMYKNYLTLREHFGLDFFHREFANEVQTMLDMVDFKVTVSEKVIAASPGARALKVIEKVNSDPANDRATSREGKLTQRPGSDTSDKVKDAVGRSGRR